MKSTTIFQLEAYLSQMDRANTLQERRIVLNYTVLNMLHLLPLLRSQNYANIRIVQAGEGQRSGNYLLNQSGHFMLLMLCC